VFRKLGIAGRMTLFVLAGAGAVLTLVVWASARHSRRLLEEELEAKAHALAAATALRIEAVEKSAGRTADELAAVIEKVPVDRESVYVLVRETVRRNQQIFGAGVNYAPGLLGPEDKGFAPYAWRSGSSISVKDLVEGDYNYQIWDWYTMPKELKRPVWSEPYFDEGGGGILMATYSVPLFAGENRERFLGVVGCDVSLNWLAEMLSSLPLGQKGYAFLISPNGTVIAHPTRQFIMNESIFSLAEERKDDALRALGRRMVKGESGFVPFVTLTTRTPSWLAFAPVSSTGWSVGLVFPKAEVTGKVRTLIVTQVLLGLIGFILLFLVVRFIARSITRPILQLDAATRVLAGGSLDAPLPTIPGEDEVAHLSRSFVAMQRDLKAYVEELKDTTAKKERVERELQIAHSIQMSLVPRTFPPFIERKDFEIYATLDPARQIGGDLYDFGLLDDDHLLITIGDVSGKGIPAALFMAVTRTFLRGFFKEELKTDVVFGRLNEELVQQGDTSMFVTLFCTVVHLPTGLCQYTNGGHCPPYVLRSSGAIEALPNVGGLIVGILPEARYKSGSFQLDPGDKLVFYTDGVTEAMNREGDFFGDERLVGALEELRGMPCHELVTKVGERVGLFAQGAEQSDDITVMAFTFWGPDFQPGA
jgi:sigma-B regulation protein RsbU (phosphoserine phosphatase)